jgi:hypothetical protein
MDFVSGKANFLAIISLLQENLMQHGAKSARMADEMRY